jgi:hypothetical protein
MTNLYKYLFYFLKLSLFSLFAIGLYFSVAYAADTTPPTTPKNPSDTTAPQTSPNVTLAPSSDDKDEVDKMFKDANYQNFNKNKPIKFFSSGG